MALQSVQQQSKRSLETIRTHAVKFCDCPVHPDGLIEVRGGQSAEYALGEAVCLADSIKELAKGGVDGGLDSEACYLIAFVADAMSAMVESVRCAIEHAGAKDA